MTVGILLWMGFFGLRPQNDRGGFAVGGILQEKFEF